MKIDHHLAGTSLTALQEGYSSNVVTSHDTVEDVVLALHIRAVDGCASKLDDLLVKQDVLGVVVESGAGPGCIGGIGPPSGNRDRNRIVHGRLGRDWRPLLRRSW